MSPYELSVLIHYYAHVDDHPDLKRDPPIWSMTTDSMKELELIACHKPAGDKSGTPTPIYHITDRGKAFVDALKQVPLPEQVWVVKWPEGVEV